MAQKKSLYEKQNKKAIKWSIVLGLALIIIGAMFVPSIFQWNTKQAEIKEFTLSNTILSQNISELDMQVQDLQNKIVEKRAEFGNTEEQILPKDIDPGKIAQLLELYAEALQNADFESFLLIDRVGVAQTQNDAEGDFAITSATISFQTNKKSLDTFIDYLQTGEINFDKTQVFKIDEVINFLEGNRLPIATLSNISFTDVENGPVEDTKSVNMEVVFYSQYKIEQETF